MTTSRTLKILSLLAVLSACSRPVGTQVSLESLPPLGEDLAAADTGATLRSKAILDRPIVELCADPHAAAVLDRDLPGLRQRPEYVAFSRMSLSQLQAASGGRLEMQEIIRVARDLSLDLPAPALRPRSYPV